MKPIALCVIALLVSLQGVSQSLTAVQAKAHEGETTKVCGTVASEHRASSSKGEPTFINLDSAYPNQLFTILVWGDDRASVGELPKIGSHVCVQGLIKDFKGVPEIVVKEKAQLRQ